jgi:hypothetical protein
MPHVFHRSSKAMELAVRTSHAKRRVNVTVPFFPHYEDECHLLEKPQSIKWVLPKALFICFSIFIF